MSQPNNPFTDEQLQRAAVLATDSGINAAAEWMKTQSPLVFGVQSIECECAKTNLTYVNLGDPYLATVLDDGNECFVGSWGDWLEGQETAYDKEHNTVGCGWCSHHTPIQNGDWRTTRCEKCGNCVSGG